MYLGKDVAAFEIAEGRARAARRTDEPMMLSKGVRGTVSRERYERLASEHENLVRALSLLVKACE